MRFNFLCTGLFLLSLAGSLSNAGAQPMKARDVAVRLADRPSRAGFEPAPTPVSMLFIGGALVLFGGLLRRRLQTRTPVRLEEEPLQR